MVAEIFRYDCSHIMLSLNDDDDDAKALPTGVLKDDAMKKGGWGGQNVSKSDGVILVCSLFACEELQGWKLGYQGSCHCSIG